MRESSKVTARVRQGGDGPARNGPPSGPKKAIFPRKLIIAFALLVLCVLAGGYWFYVSQERLHKEEAEKNLETVAQLKIGQIMEWREERLAAASILMESPFLNEAVAGWSAAPRPALTEELLALFRSRQKHYYYHDVLLVDAKARVRMSLRGHSGILHEDAAQALAAAFREHRPVLTDLHLGPRDLPPHIDIIAPFFAASGKIVKPVGAIILQSDARKFLYPLVQSWPTPSPSAETLLVRRDGDSVLYLNELRHQKDTALKLRIPLSRQDLPAVRVVLGREGIFSGKDYRGVKVLTVLKAIPNSPWFMVAKVDTAEVFSAWRFETVLILSILIMLLMTISVGTGVAWQVSQKIQYRTLYETEAALKQSEIRYHTTLMSVGDGVIATDVQGLVQLMNPTAETLTGWKLDEASGRPLEEVFPIVNEETRQKVENPVRRVVRDGLVVGLANHSVLVSRGGREYAVADSGAPVRSEKGEIIGVVLVFRDQTEQRAAIKALRESEEKFRNTLDNMLEGCQIIGFDWRYVYVNEAAAKHGRRSKQEFVGYTMMESYPGIERTEMFAVLKRCMENRVPHQMENKFSFPDGRQAWFQLNMEPVPEGVFILSLDISQRKQAEEEISRLNQELERRITERTAQLQAANNELAREVVERKQAQEELLRLNRELSVLYTISRATSQYMNLEETLINALEATLGALDVEVGGIYLLEPEGETLTLRAVRGVSDEVAENLRHVKLGEGMSGKAAAEKKPVVLDVQDYPSQRLASYIVQEKLQSLASMPLLSAGRPVGAMNLSTRRVRAFPPEELELLTAIGLQLGNVVQNARLYEALRERTAQLEATNSELESFSYSVSHDLRAPLRALDGFSSILLSRYSKQLDKEGQHFLDRIQAASQRMGQLINDLLNLSRVVRAALTRQRVDLSAVAREIAAELQQREPERRVEFVIAPKMVVDADPHLIGIALHNLLENAWKFSGPRGQAHIELGVLHQPLPPTSSSSSGEKAEGDGQAAMAGEGPVYFVRDNGVGFDMAYAGKLFSPFQRLHGMQEFPGTGIGLATVKRIVTRHGGRVWAEAAVNEGATFYFTLGGPNA